MAEPFRLDGRTAMVTGGASGIGESICRRFSAAGAEVLIVDRDRPRAEALQKELAGSKVLICDINIQQNVVEMFSGIARLDILVNNAGIGHVGGIEETEVEHFERLFDVNVKGLFLVTRMAMRLLLASRGTIINIGSVAGLIGIRKRFAYCATKGAVVAMTRQLAVDYPTQLRVNCICPGTVDTPFVEGFLERFHKHEKEKVRAELNQRQPMGRLGRPDEIAAMALYLASDEAGFVNGSVLTIDGGWTAA